MGAHLSGARAALGYLGLRCRDLCCLWFGFGGRRTRRSSVEQVEDEKQQFVRKSSSVVLTPLEPPSYQTQPLPVQPETVGLRRELYAEEDGDYEEDGPEGKEEEIQGRVCWRDQSLGSLVLSAQWVCRDGVVSVYVERVDGVGLQEFGGGEAEEWGLLGQVLGKAHLHREGWKVRAETRAKVGDLLVMKVPKHWIRKKETEKDVAGASSPHPDQCKEGEVSGMVLRMSLLEPKGGQCLEAALGHALMPLRMLREQPSQMQVRLLARSTPLRKRGKGFRGMLQLSLSYQPNQCRLSVVALQVRGLAIPPQPPRLMCLVQAALFSAGEEVKVQHCSPVLASASSPDLFFEDAAFSFMLPLGALQAARVVVSVRCRTPIFRRQILLGHLVLGPLCRAGDGTLTPWGCAVQARQVLTAWHRLYL